VHISTSRPTFWGPILSCKIVIPVQKFRLTPHCSYVGYKIIELIEEVDCLTVTFITDLTNNLSATERLSDGIDTWALFSIVIKSNDIA
jgi:hypothetical protein